MAQPREAIGATHGTEQANETRDEAPPPTQSHRSWPDFRDPKFTFQLLQTGWRKCNGAINANQHARSVQTLRQTSEYKVAEV